MAAGLSQTPSAERYTIGFFGRTNAGKSTLFNLATGEDRSIVSDIKGTTTDPVSKPMELLPIGPVLLIDAPGLLDGTPLGNARGEKVSDVKRRVDLAVVVLDLIDINDNTIPGPERELIDEFAKRDTPVLVALNKTDAVSRERAAALAECLKRDCPECSLCRLSAREGGEDARKRFLSEIAAVWEGHRPEERHIVSDFVSANDTVILVIPIDGSAPKGRLILPQVLVLRELLDARAAAICVQPDQLGGVLAGLNEPPALVITDSQAFKQVSETCGKDICLTSFSVLMSAYKGDIRAQTEGARAVSRLRPGSKVLIAEGCSHHRQCNDIGSVQIPAAVRRLSGADMEFEFTGGQQFPGDLTGYDLIIHCGGCMINEREMRFRIREAKAAGVPITNYGILMAYAAGIMDEVTEVIFRGTADKERF